MTSLRHLKPGDRARIKSVSRIEDTAFALRLQEMGLTAGCEIEIAHQAPFGGAVAVRARSTIIAIRMTDALCIDVEKL